MSTATVHLAYKLDPSLPLTLQATSLYAELDACAVFQRAARADLLAGDIRALGRIAALNDHEKQLHEALDRIQQRP